ncbi:uncharacterized protein TNCV_4498041 [Trichonephila clavipes]|nr:uncharacterized protein TNCV_4498041 [Trichonephila clavipes]
MRMIEIKLIAKRRDIVTCCNSQPDEKFGGFQTLLIIKTADDKSSRRRTLKHPFSPTHVPELSSVPFRLFSPSIPEEERESPPLKRVEVPSRRLRSNEEYISGSSHLGGHFSSACIRNENRAATFHFNHVFEFCFPKDSSPAAGLTRVESCGDQRTSVSGINREQPIPCSGYLVKSGL